MIKQTLLIAAGIVLSGCTLGNINSIHRSPNITKGGSQIVDAKQRFIVTYDKPDDRTNYISCAEPSPDVFSVYAASGELSVSKGDVGGAGSFSSAETGASLLERTTSLQALRDAYFRLCEGYANGAIDEIDFMIGQRHNQTALMGLLAIENLKAAARAPAVVIGGSASATSASGIQRLTSGIVSLSTRNSVIKKEKAAADEKIKKLETEIDAIKDEIKILDKATPKDAKAIAAKNAEQKEKEKKLEKLKGENEIRTVEMGSNAKAIAALEKGLENAAATGSMAASSLPVIIDNGKSCEKGCASEKEAIAKQMVEIVKELNNDDYGPTICLSYFRRKERLASKDAAGKLARKQITMDIRNAGGTAKETASFSPGAENITNSAAKIDYVCGVILDAYAEQLKNSGAQLRVLKGLAPAIIKSENSDLIKALIEALGKTADASGIKLTE